MLAAVAPRRAVMIPRGVHPRLKQHIPHSLGPSYFFISLVLGPRNSLAWYVPFLRYIRGLGWRMHCGVEITESSTNNNIISQDTRRGS